MHIDTGINQEPRRPSLPGLVGDGGEEGGVLPGNSFVNVYSMASGCPAVVMSRTSEPKVSPKVLWTGY